MSVGTSKLGNILDHAHGEDTAAFLDELVNDKFSDWHLTDPKKKAKVPKPIDTDNRKLKSAPVKPAAPQPQRKWTRFPRREPSTQDTPVEKVKNATKTDSASLLDTEDATHVNNILDYLQLEPSGYEDVSDARFEIRHRKMENYLKDLRCDGQKRGVHSVQETRRQSSPTFLESTATSGWASSQKHNVDIFSACTEEELIASKMEDVKEKFKNNIRHNWLDDVQLALLVMKRKSRTGDLKSDEIKHLLDILN